jgi:hypothetical protein
VSKDQAARIVLAAFTVREDGRSFYTRPQLEGRIRRAIASAVRKERERCARCAFDIRIKELREHSTRVGAFVANDIIKAINGGKR